MVIPGIVTNAAASAPFVDIGVRRNGLIHISELVGHFMQDPAEIVQVRQAVQVRVLGVDHQRRRVALSMEGDGSGDR